MLNLSPRNRAVSGLPEPFFVGCELLPVLIGKGEAAESVPDVADGLVRRMEHVLGIEAVVAELVHHDFI